MAMQKQKIEFAPWEPDMAKLEGRAAHEAKNVLPSKRGYVPMPSLARQLGGPAYPAAPIEAVSYCGTDGTRLTYAASTWAIRALEQGADGNLAWVTKISGLQGQRCSFFRYGSTVYALMGGRLYSAEPSGGTTGNFTAVSNSASSGSIPIATVAAVVQDFVVLGDLDGMPSAIRWSAIDDPTCWPAVGSDDAINKQSDIQVFPEGGRVMAITGGIGASVSGIVFLEHAIQRMQYIGSPYIFQFSPIERGQGLLAPRSPVVCGSRCFFLSEDGWRVTDGSTSQGIGAHRVDRWFFELVDANRMDEVKGVHDIQRRLAWWFFPSRNCPVGRTDTALVYDYETDRWSWGEVACRAVFTDYGRQVTLEQLDELGGLEELPYRSLDAVPQGGSPTLAAFDGSSRVCSFDGPALTGTVTTQEMGGERFMLHGLRPLVDGGVCEVKPVYRNRQQDAQRFGKGTRPARDGVCYQHLSTVYLSASVTIPGGQAWSHATGVEVLMEPEGGM